MKPDDPFESRLRDQPFRQLPAEWRGEILEAAAAQGERPLVARRGIADVWRLRVRELLWPCPRAWAGLALVWIAILAINFATAEPEPQLAAPSAPTPEKRELLRQQQQMLAELTRTEEPAPLKSAPSTPQPRSELRTESVFA
jgi:hypothetical protein